MHIHTVKEHETAASIAGSYGISCEALEINNGITSGERLAIGEELLILTPTRTYTARRGDTPERLSMRFGIRRSELFGMNPGLGSPMKGSETVILKYDERTHGMAASNGYFYEGCGLPELRAALPYTTYISVAACTVKGDELCESFDASEIVRTVSEGERVPLLRIYDGGDEERYKSGEWRSLMTEKMIGAAVDGGYKGITLGCTAKDGDGADALAEFIVELRGRMIGCDLILITEIDEKTPLIISELSDGSVLSYGEYGDDAPGFAEGERRVFGDFACNGESAKTFIDLPAFASLASGYATIGDAVGLARRARNRITTDGESHLSSFDNKRYGTVKYPSLKNIKARLDLIAELGFMGMSFDIMRTPIAHLLMYNALFKTVGYTSVRSREGCSRGLEG